MTSSHVIARSFCDGSRKKSSYNDVLLFLVDLATFDELEKYCYGGSKATAYFVRETRKSTWFTQVPVVLSRVSGTPQFAQDWAVQISRAGDYLLNTWLRAFIPSVTLATTNQFGANGRLRWTRNLMHNLVRECCITFNDLVAARFDSYQLDFWAAFTVPAGKQNGYLNMIGTVDALIQEHSPGAPNAIPAAVLNLPLPFFYTRDCGFALPTAALPYNEMRINFSFRDWSDLLILDNLAAPIGTNPSTPPLLSDLGGTAPVLGSNTNVFATYAIVSNDERKRMACAPRDILIEQVQTAPRQNYTPTGTTYAPNFDLRFSHAVKVLFFAVRNRTTKSEWSNYTAASPIPGATVVNFTPVGAVDPISNTTLVYENTNRLGMMGSDYYSLVVPWYTAPVIPIATGYHVYSYSLAFFDVDPMGSTDYGKLTNVSIIPEASQGALVGAAGTGPDGSGLSYPQIYEFITTAVNNNVIRISGGALGFPIL